MRHRTAQAQRLIAVGSVSVDLRSRCAVRASVLISRVAFCGQEVKSENMIEKVVEKTVEVMKTVPTEKLVDRIVEVVKKVPGLCLCPPVFPLFHTRSHRPLQP
eukprot:2643174-Rhodomonas_salina.2